MDGICHCCADVFLLEDPRRRGAAGIEFHLFAKVANLNFTQLGRKDGSIVVHMLVTLKVHVTKLVKRKVQFKT